MTTKTIEEKVEMLIGAVERMHKQLMDLKQRHEQLEFAITNGVPSNPKGRSPAVVEKAAGNPGGPGGDFI